MARGQAEDGIETEPDEQYGSAPGEVRLAALVIALQAGGLVVVGLILLVKTATGEPDDLGRALLDAAFALLGAVVLVLAARSILALRTALRTPVIVLELLALPVGWSLGFQAGRIGFAAPLLISALAVLYLLFTPPARQALERRL